MKLKTKTKKMLVLSVMVVLLVATGVLNFVLNDKISMDNQQLTPTPNVTETFFESCRSERSAMRESELLTLNAIVDNSESSSDKKSEAQSQIMSLTERMELENQLETLIKSKGFGDAYVVANEVGVSAVVSHDEMSVNESNQILSIICTNSEYMPTEVKIQPYSN